MEVLQKMIEETGLDPTGLKLELTESLLMRDQDLIIPRLKAIKSLGVGLAIDDFGTGYSSLSYLKQFPVDSLKIDQSFVKNIPDDSDDVAIAEMIIVLAAQLKLEVVAEAIETKAQRDFLLSRGCQSAQGYLFGRPVSAEEMTDFLEKTFKRNSIHSLPLDDAGRSRVDEAHSLPSTRGSVPL